MFPRKCSGRRRTTTLVGSPRLELGRPPYQGGMITYFIMSRFLSLFCMVIVPPRRFELLVWVRPNRFKRPIRSPTTGTGDYIVCSTIFVELLRLSLSYFFIHFLITLSATPYFRPSAEKLLSSISLSRMS